MDNDCPSCKQYLLRLTQAIAVGVHCLTRNTRKNTLKGNRFFLWLLLRFQSLLREVHLPFNDRRAESKSARGGETYDFTSRRPIKYRLFNARWHHPQNLSGAFIFHPFNGSKFRRHSYLNGCAQHKHKGRVRRWFLHHHRKLFSRKRALC